MNDGNVSDGMLGNWIPKSNSGRVTISDRPGIDGRTKAGKSKIGNVGNWIPKSNCGNTTLSVSPGMVGSENDGKLKLGIDGRPIPKLNCGTLKLHPGTSDHPDTHNVARLTGSR